MDFVIRIYRQNKIGMVNGISWKKSSGLSGAIGSIVKGGENHYHIVLDSIGNGVSSGQTGRSIFGNRRTKTIANTQWEISVTDFRIDIKSLQNIGFEVSIFTINGDEILSKKFSLKTKAYSIDMKKVTSDAGNYFLKLHSGNINFEQSIHLGL